MYTILWENSEGRQWEQLQSRDEVITLLALLKLAEDVDENEVIIFTPGAHDYVSDYKGFTRSGEIV